MTAPPDFEFTELYQAVHAALRAWDAPEEQPHPWWTRSQAIKNHAPDDDGSGVILRQAIRQALQTGLADLAQQNPQSAAILQQHFCEGQKLLAIANALRLSQDQVKREQKKAITGLAEILHQQERRARQRQIEQNFAQIEPPTYGVLFGVDEVQQKLAAALLASGPPWVAAIAGIGGIGKTAVADAVVRHIIQQLCFAQIIWLRINAPTLTEADRFARPTLDKLIMLQLAQRLNVPVNASPEERQRQVRQALKTLPCLVIIDNLETDLDAAFLAHLHDLANPSKFLLTTRTLPPVQAGVWRHAMLELSLNEAAALLRHEASRLGQREHLANIDDQQVRRIYEKVGGNPLALKLVIGLGHDFQEFDLVIADLTAAHLPDIAAMYRHIYWKTWRALSPDSRLLLEHMPLAADIGMLEEQMKGISGMDRGNLLAAIHELIRRSLLEVRGAPSERRYGIHPLTRSFLLTDIINWPQ